MGTQGMIRSLQTISSLESLGFYVTKSDNRNAELHVAIGEFPVYSKSQMEVLSHELNAAIYAVVKARCLSLHESIAANYSGHVTEGLAP